MYIKICLKVDVCKHATAFSIHKIIVIISIWFLVTVCVYFSIIKYSITPTKMIELFYQFSYSSLSMDRKRPKNNTSSVPELTIYASIGGGLEHFALCIGHNILNISCIPSLFRIKRFDITCRISWWSIDKYLPATDSLNSGGSRHIAITVAWMCVSSVPFFHDNQGLGGLSSDNCPHIYLHIVHMNPNDGDGDNLIWRARRHSDEPDEPHSGEPDESHSDSDEPDLIPALSSVREPLVYNCIGANRWRWRCNRSEVSTHSDEPLSSCLFVFGYCMYW